MGNDDGGAGAILHAELVRYLGVAGDVIAEAIERYVARRLGAPHAGPGLATARELQAARRELARARGGGGGGDGAGGR